MVIGLSTSAMYLSAGELLTKRAVVKNDGSEQVEASVYFTNETEGDLYTAALINRNLLFLADEGSKFTFDPLPIYTNQIYIESVPLFNFSGAKIPPANYPLFQVVVEAGKDLLNPDNWINGWAGMGLT